jgi:hypothetical protein
MPIPPQRTQHLFGGDEQISKLHTHRVFDGVDDGRRPRRQRHLANAVELAAGEALDRSVGFVV